MTRKITEINIHCSATRPGWMVEGSGLSRVAEIRNWHVKQNGWADIGYHWVIDRDGSTYPGRPEQKTGAFEPKVNTTAIGVCLLGGYGSEATDQFDQHYTKDQDHALRDLIEDLRARYPEITKVTGHNDYAAKACPGFNVGRWLTFSPPRKFVQSGTALGSGTAAIGATGLAVEQVTQALTEARTAVEQARDTQDGMSGFDPVRALLVCIILVGAAFAFYRRWRDWKAGRK